MKAWRDIYWVCFIFFYVRNAITVLLQFMFKDCSISDYKSTPNALLFFFFASMGAHPGHPSVSTCSAQFVFSRNTSNGNKSFTCLFSRSANIECLFFSSSYCLINEQTNKCWKKTVTIIGWGQGREETRHHRLINCWCGVFVEVL